MKVLDWIVWWSFVTALVALPILVVNWLIFVVRRSRAPRTSRGSIPFPLKSILFFSLPSLVVLAGATLSKSIANTEIISTIQSFDAAAQVSINGKSVQNQTEVLSALRTRHWVLGHHSQPTTRISIQIWDRSRSLVLSLARDSNDPREYWVFYPKYYITSGNETGRIKTSVFDNY